MVKFSDLLKIFFVFLVVEFCCTMPLSDDNYYVNGVSDEIIGVPQKVHSRIVPQYEQDYPGGIPIAAIAQPNYWPMSSYQSNHKYPYYNEKMKTWMVSPSKRNSELINSLLGLPKNMETAGK